MALQAGTRLGPYEVLSLLGAGGMGEVYRARDTRLGREVAIKVLPADRVSDPDRRRRFVQEAQAASALNHPHIITIHEIESADGNDFIVMEYVRGNSLDAIIPSRGMRLTEALRIAIAVADALAAAHARNIIHRDLKPANVIVGTDRAVKVLDFGLAKLVGDADTAGEDSPTLTSTALVSAPGTIAGTAAYMSPEQAVGEPVDGRSDIFSFGAMLYEMATGTRAFAADSAADTRAAVVRAQPNPPTQVVATLPRELERVILRCLRKEPDRRYQTMLDVRNDLQDLDREIASPSSEMTARPQRRWWGVVVVTAIMTLGAVIGWWRWNRTDIPPPPMQVRSVTGLNGYEMMPSLSPDGDQVAFAWNGDKDGANVDLYVSMVGRPAVHRVTTHPLMDVFPHWSPDGRQIAFVRESTDHTGHVYVVSPLGGPERKLSDFDAHFDRVALFGDLSWSPDGRYVAAARSSTQRAGESTGIYLIPVQGGEPRLLTQAKAPASDRDPAISHDGRRLAYLSCANCCYGRCDVMTVELDAELRPVGAPRRLTSMNSQMEGLAWTRDGRSLIFRGLTGVLYHLWRVDVDGRHPPERIEVTGSGARRPSTVPSRDRLVYSRPTDDTDIYQVGTKGSAHALSPSSFPDFLPTFSPDGTQIAFCSARSGDMSRIWVVRADGTEPRQLTGDVQGGQCSPSWSPDGRTLAFQTLSDHKIWTIDVEGANLRRITGAGSYHNPTWSRDGASMYVSKVGATDSASTSKPNSSSRVNFSHMNLWRIPVAGGPGAQVTQSGGFKGLETADGKALVYQPGTDRSGLPILITPLSSRSPRQLVRCAYGFSVGSKGVYYYPCRPEGLPVALGPRKPIEIRVIDPATGRDRAVATLTDLLHGDVLYGPSVSPDGSTFLYPKVVNRGEDLMMIENFR
jgi:serine/threonine protein kinase/Tol biopolymer transport system component